MQSKNMNYYNQIMNFSKKQKLTLLAFGFAALIIGHIFWAPTTKWAGYVIVAIVGALYTIPKEDILVQRDFAVASGFGTIVVMLLMIAMYGAYLTKGTSFEFLGLVVFIAAIVFLDMIFKAIRTISSKVITLNRRRLCRYNLYNLAKNTHSITS